jgi:DNA-nicking Smr family endonuclease
VSAKDQRRLSAAEQALWRDFAGTVAPAPWRRGAKAHEAVKPLSPPLRPARLPEPPVSAPARKQSKPAAPPPPSAGLDRRARQRLARGVEPIDARLDLHGQTQAEARAALLRFVQRAQADGARFTLVITGKGARNGEGGERGVLRRQVPFWLGLPEFRSYVIGFEDAHAGHGGAGALYVRIRRLRPLARRPV